MSFPHNSAACPCAPCEARRQADQLILSFEKGYSIGLTEAQNAAQYTLAQFEAEIYMLRTHIQALAGHVGVCVQREATVTATAAAADGVAAAADGAAAAAAAAAAPPPPPPEPVPVPVSSSSSSSSSSSADTDSVRKGKGYDQAQAIKECLKLLSIANVLQGASKITVYESAMTLVHAIYALLSNTEKRHVALGGNSAVALDGLDKAMSAFVTSRRAAFAAIGGVWNWRLSIDGTALEPTIPKVGRGEVVAKDLIETLRCIVTEANHADKHLMSQKLDELAAAVALLGRGSPLVVHIAAQILSRVCGVETISFRDASTAHGSVVRDVAGGGGGGGVEADADADVASQLALHVADVLDKHVKRVGAAAAPSPALPHIAKPALPSRPTIVPKRNSLPG